MSPSRRQQAPPCHPDDTTALRRAKGELGRSGVRRGPGLLGKQVATTSQTAERHGGKRAGLMFSNNDKAAACGGNRKKSKKNHHQTQKDKHEYEQLRNNRTARVPWSPSVRVSPSGAWGAPGVRSPQASFSPPLLSIRTEGAETEEPRAGDTRRVGQDHVPWGQAALW